MTALLAAPLVMTVHPGHVLRNGLDRYFGINLNYIRDEDANRRHARPLDSALEILGVRWLRYPGGEKSNHYLWAEPPYRKPAPRSLGWYASQPGIRMDFDQFMDHCRAVRAEPYVVVGCAPEAKSGLSLARWAESAAAWVRYSRAKHYGVRYWEIGNENWNGKEWGPREAGLAVAEVSRAMKAVDPSIKVGASGNDEKWWAGFLPSAAPYIDFLSVSDYPGWEWKGYERVLERPNLTEAADDAIRAIQLFTGGPTRPKDGVIVAETNTNDWTKGGWPNSNDLGHALTTFLTLGTLASRPEIKSTMLWGTRWMDDAEASRTVYYALGPGNEVMPSGDALLAWGIYARAELIEVDGSDDAVRAFGSMDTCGARMTLWLLNLSQSPRLVRYEFDGSNYRTVGIKRFAGTSETDQRPLWTKPTRFDPLLPPLSLTVLLLQRT